MKKIVSLLLIFFLGSISIQTFAQKNDRAVVCFKSNMDCSDCEKTLYEHLKFEKGVKDLKIDHSSNTILIEYFEKKNNEQGFSRAIEKKGYKAEKIDRKTYDKIIENKNIEGHNHQQEVHKKRN